MPSLIRSIEHDFSQTDAGLGFLYFVGALFWATGGLSAGLLTERVGRRVMLPLAAASLGVGLAGFAFAPSWPLFVLAAVPLSLGGGGIDAGVNGLFLDLHPGQGQRPQHAPLLLQRRRARGPVRRRHPRRQRRGLGAGAAWNRGGRTRRRPPLVHLGGCFWEAHCRACSRWSPGRGAGADHPAATAGDRHRLLRRRRDRHLELAGPLLRVGAVDRRRPRASRSSGAGWRQGGCSRRGSQIASIRSHLPRPARCSPASPAWRRCSFRTCRHRSRSSRSPASGRARSTR